MATTAREIERQIATKKEELYKLEAKLKAIKTDVVTSVTGVGYLSTRRLIVDVDDGEGVPSAVIVRFGDRTLAKCDTQVYEKVP